MLTSLQVLSSRRNIDTNDLINLYSKRLVLYSQCTGDQDSKYWFRVLVLLNLHSQESPQPWRLVFPWQTEVIYHPEALPRIVTVNVHLVSDARMQSPSWGGGAKPT